jgi:hypothetical protein
MVWRPHSLDARKRRLFPTCWESPLVHGTNTLLARLQSSRWRGCLWTERGACQSAPYSNHIPIHPLPASRLVALGTSFRRSVVDLGLNDREGRGAMLGRAALGILSGFRVLHRKDFGIYAAG